MLELIEELDSAVTVGDARAYVRVFGTEFDDVLQTLIDAGIEYVESETRLDWRPRKWRFSSDSGTIPDVWAFPQSPVISIDAVKTSNGNAIAIASANKSIDLDPPLLLGVGSLGGAVVEWTAGTNKSNSRFKLCVLQFVADNFDNPGGSRVQSAAVLRLLESIKSGRDAIR